MNECIESSISTIHTVKSYGRENISYLCMMGTAASLLHLFACCCTLATVGHIAVVEE
jgi:hypothetical protein